MTRRTPKRPTRSFGLRARDTHRQRLQALPNVVGSMIGRKYIDGDRQAETSVVVLVRRKRALSRLGAGEKIPKYLRVGDRRIRTDVLAIGALTPQAWKEPVLCSDEYERGAVSLFWRLPGGGFQGLTCAHVLGGMDKDPHTPTDVWLRRGEDQDLKAGKTQRVFYNSGLGQSDDYGFDDIVSFSVDARWAANEASGLRPIGVKTVTDAARGLVMGVAGDKLYGDVRGVCMEYAATYCDYLIDVDRPGTRGGHSGGLWRTADGAAVAIHASGGEEYDTGGSSLSACMSVARLLRRRFNVDPAQLRAPD